SGRGGRVTDTAGDRGTAVTDPHRRRGDRPGCAARSRSAAGRGRLILAVDLARARGLTGRARGLRTGGPIGRGRPFGRSRRRYGRLPGRGRAGVGDPPDSRIAGPGGTGTSAGALLSAGRLGTALLLGRGPGAGGPAPRPSGRLLTAVVRRAAALRWVGFPPAVALAAALRLVTAGLLGRLRAV